VDQGGQQVRQFGDVHRDAPRLVLGHEFGSRSPPQLLLVIRVGERLPTTVRDDEAGWPFLDEPGRRESARRGRFMSRHPPRLVLGQPQAGGYSK